MNEYQPDKMNTHLMYVIEARKKSAHERCNDEFTGKVHSKEDCDAIIASLRKLGYVFQVSRVSNTDILDEELPKDVDEGNTNG